MPNIFFPLTLIFRLLCLSGPTAAALKITRIDLTVQPSALPRCVVYSPQRCPWSRLGWHLSDCQNRSIPLVLTRVQCMQKVQRIKSPPRVLDKRPLILISSSDFEPWSVCRDKLRFPAVHTCLLYQAQLTLPYW
jgi:hypothetical protein